MNKFDLSRPLLSKEELEEARLNNFPYIDIITFPFFRALFQLEMNGNDYKRFLAFSNAFRKEFSSCYKRHTECPRLEEMTKAEKDQLWKESGVLFTKMDRLMWCEAVRYYEFLRSFNSGMQ